MCGACANDKHCIRDGDCLSKWCDTRVSLCKTITCVQPSYTSAGSGLTSIAPLTADFDSDGKLDLVVTTPTTFGIASGNGDGTFATPMLFSAISAGASFRIAEWEGNGVADMLVTWTDHAQAFQGAGDGTFKRGPDVTPGVGSNDVWCTGDFDGDHKGDLYVHAGTTLHKYPGLGDGTFGTDVTADFFNQPIKSMAATREATHNGFAFGTIGVGGHYVQTTRAGKIPLSAYNIASPAAAFAADLDGDGLDEVVFDTGSMLSPPPPTGTHPSWQVTGVVVRTSPTDFYDFAATNGTLYAVGDFNGDGKVDLLMQGGTKLMCGNGDTTFQAAITLTTPITSVVQGDFNGDGRMDYVDTSGVVHLNTN
jgi:hypothetical protein